MRSITNTEDQSNVILRNRQLNFVNLVATVTDSRVQEDTLILVYYSESSKAAASAAGITAQTNTGNITFTAVSAPSQTIVCDIVLLSANIVNQVATASDVDYSNTTSGLTATDVQGAVDELALSQSSPLSHNGIYTGRNLGTISSAADWTTFRTEYGIADKSYKGLYLGDYVKVNDGTYNADWMVAGFNTETNKGSTNVPGACVSMIPRLGSGCGSSYMNSTNITTGGYNGSYMHTTKLPDIAAKLTTIFGSNLVTRDILVSNAVTDGHTSSREWVACKCSLLTSVQVFGSLTFENTGGSYFAGYNIGEGCEKLPIFNFINPVQFSHAGFWLRGVASATAFCVVDGSGGGAYPASASLVTGVRPLICLN